MFITLTIDTNKNKNKAVKISKSKISPAKGWRKAIHAKKRTLWQRVLRWRRSLKPGKYILKGQASIF